MVMSAQLLHTCAVASQSYRKPNTYFPGLTFGTLTTSSTDGCSLIQLASHGGGNGKRPHGIKGGGLEHREQSLPAVSGQSRHAPELQLPGVVQPSLSSPFLQPHLKSPGW